MWACNVKNQNQQWRYTAATGQIKATHGKCLDASQRNTNGGKVHMWACNVKNQNQQWRYTAATGQIKATHGKCLDAAQRNTNGGKVHMWSCHTGNQNQQWLLLQADCAALTSCTTNAHWLGYLARDNVPYY